MNIFKIFSHEHNWRRLTAKDDYGNARSKHLGGYTGVEQEECRICKITREVRGWQEWRYEMDDAEARVEYLKTTEPQKQLKQ